MDWLNDPINWKDWFNDLYKWVIQEILGDIGIGTAADSVESVGLSDKCSNECGGGVLCGGKTDCHIKECGVITCPSYTW